MNASPARRAGIAQAGIALCAALPLASQAQADFQRFCARALTDDAPAWFDARLVEVQTALDAGDVERARRAHAEATRLPRTADVSVPVKCVGEDRFERWYEQRRALDQAAAAARPGDWRAQLAGALAAAAPDPGTVAATVPAQPGATRSAIATLQSRAERPAEQRARGAFVLDAERAEADVARQAAARLTARAETSVTRLLNDEQRAFASPVRDDERQLSAGIEAAESMAAGVTGIAPEAGRAETRPALIRGERATDTLRGATEWADIAGGGAVARVRERAIARGDRFRQAARNEAHAFAVRDDHYELAMEFYEIANAAERVAATRADREAIADDVAEERRQREAAADRARERMQQEARKIEEAARDMQNTDAEKDTFNDEFDSEFGDMDDFFD